jgi:hypothetical protein
MGSENKKKAREKFLLDRFIEHQGITPTSIETPEPPGPDFSIEIDDCKVGIELTEIFVRSPKSGARPQSSDLPQAVESRPERIVSGAREAYFQRNNPPVLVNIVFSNLDSIEKKEQIEEVAHLIAREVEDMASETLLTADRRPNFNTNGGNLLFESVAFIHIYGVPELRFARWDFPKVGLVSRLTAKHLQDRIDAKEKKMNQYTRNGDEIWLLMVADTTRTSQKFRHPPDFSPETLSSRFSKTFYYCYGADYPVVEFS